MLSSQTLQLQPQMQIAPLQKEKQEEEVMNYLVN